MRMPNERLTEHHRINKYQDSFYVFPSFCIPRSSKLDMCVCVCVCVLTNDVF